MSIERADEHPTFELAGNAITSLAEPSLGAAESVLFRVVVPPGGGLPRHHHDHLDVFVVEMGSGAIEIDGSAEELVAGDSALVPSGAWHLFTAGPDGATLVVTMLAGTKLIREDGVVVVPPWVG